MNAEFKAKFLQTLLSNKKDNEGFTLIELLVVIIIIGILAAIALPSFLNQANKAKQSEAKTYVGSMNRSQQAYYLEQNTFAGNADFGSLGMGIATETANYKYIIADGGAGSSQVTNQAQQVQAAAPLKAYVGGVNVGTIAGTGEATTLAITCEGEKSAAEGGATGGDTVAYGSPPACPGNYIDLGS